MERKTTESYTLVLKELKKICEERNITIQKFVSDYEEAMRLAISGCFPGSSIVGCHFHYARAVFMRFKKFGLTRNSTEEKTRAIKMAMCISLLPTNCFNQAIEIIKGIIFYLFDF